MLKKIITGVLTASMLLNALPINVLAENASGSGIYNNDFTYSNSDYSYNDDEADDDSSYSNNQSYNDEADNRNSSYSSSPSYNYEQEESQIPDGEFVYAETSTESTTVSLVVDQSGITTPDGIVANINIQAEAAVLLDANTGIMLYGKKAEQKMYPASITKMMTVLIACEEGNLDDMVTVSNNAVNSIPWDSSKANLEAGEEISLRDLLYGVMLVSGNDAAVVVAEHIAGSEEAFVEKMNKRAQEIGCKNTNFVNPHGYHDENHYSTALDMALIAREASKNDNMNKIWGSSDHSVAATNLYEPRVFKHSDKMLQPTTSFYDERVKGGKTGFHNKALNTLASYATNGNIKLVSVVMKANGYDPTYTDTSALLDYGFELYRERKLYGKDQFEQLLPVIQNYKDEVIDLGTVNVTLSKDLTAYTPSFINSDTVTIKSDLPEQLIAPVAADKVVGTVTVSYGDVELGKIDVVPMCAVDSIPEKELKKQRVIEAVLKVLKVTLIIVICLAVIFVIVIFALRSWFIKQRKRNGGKIPQYKKKKFKIRMK